MKTVENLKRRYADFQALDARDKKTFWKEFALNNALYVLIIIAIIYTAVQNPNFVTPSCHQRTYHSRCMCDRYEKIPCS